MSAFQKLQVRFMAMVVRLLFDIAQGYVYAKEEPIKKFEDDCNWYITNREINET